MRTSGLSFGSPRRASDTGLSEGRSPTHRQHRCTAPAVRPLRWGTPAEIQWPIAIDARSLDIGKPQTNNGRCGNQPANKSLINRRLKPHRRPCALLGPERSMLGEIGHQFGRTALAEVATVAKPDTILAWYRKLVAHKFDGSKARRGPGRPRVTRKVEQLIVRLAEENRDWGYDRIAGALANLGYRVCDQTVGNILQRHGLPPERKRTTTWSAFIRTHLALLAG